MVRDRRFQQRLDRFDRSVRSMKILLLLVVATTAMIASAAAEVLKTLPDLSEGFPSVESFLGAKDKDTEMHGYVTRLGFTTVKAQFLAFLGDGWSEVPSESTKDPGRAKEQHLITKGKCRFSNPAFPGIEISLAQFGSDAQLYDVVAIVFTRRGARQVAQGQMERQRRPAPVPDPSRSLIFRAFASWRVWPSVGLCVASEVILREVDGDDLVVF